MPRTNVDTDILNEAFLFHEELQNLVDDGGFNIDTHILGALSSLDWIMFHLRNSIDHGESYGENLKLRSRK